MSSDRRDGFWHTLHWIHMAPQIGRRPYVNKFSGTFSGVFAAYGWLTAEEHAGMWRMVRQLAAMQA